MSLVNHLHWRYATQKFDPTKIIPEEEITQILKGMNLAPSAWGLQPYRFVVVHNKELQHDLGEVSAGQLQLAQASHVIIFAAQTSIELSDIETYRNHRTETNHPDPQMLAEYMQEVKDFFSAQSTKEYVSWVHRQCYIPLGILISICSEMKIDACPIERFDADKVDALLGFPDKGLTASVIVPLGYRSVDDSAQHDKKVRKTLEEMVHLYYGNKG